MSDRRGFRTKLFLAFAAVYTVWGSTYLAIRFAVETIPPFLMGGVRFIISGAILYAWSRARDGERPTRLHWRNATIVGAFLLVGGNGGVVWAEQFVPSGITALLVAILPLWMVVLDWLRPGGRRPTRGVVAGLVLGTIGIVVLVGPEQLGIPWFGGESGNATVLDGDAHASAGVPIAGAIVLVLASLSWAAGSIYSNHSKLPASGNMATGMEMLTGGALMLVPALLMSEFQEFAAGAVSLRSFVSFAYLIAFGSLIGFTAYMWLLKNAPPARVATYAYVNPVVAVLLGWAFAGEALTLRTGIAAAIIVAAVAVITTAQAATVHK